MFAVAGSTSMDQKTRFADELEIITENPNPRSTKEPSPDEQKLNRGTVAQNQNLKHPSKTVVQSLHLNCQHSNKIRSSHT